MSAPFNPADEPLPPRGSAFELAQPVSVHEDGSVAAFDQSMVVVSPDEDLLSGAPSRTLTKAMNTVVASLRSIDAERVARKRSWFDRFTGADIEAWLEFELAVRSIGTEMRRLATAAQNAHSARALMQREAGKLEAANHANAALIDRTRNQLYADVARHERLERRLANLEALHASQQLARAQVLVAIESLTGLLDRYREIETLLFPVWQQHALAVAQSATSSGDLSDELAELALAQGRFGQALGHEKDISG